VLRAGWLAVRRLPLPSEEALQPNLLAAKTPTGVSSTTNTTIIIIYVVVLLLLLLLHTAYVHLKNTCTYYSNYCKYYILHVIQHYTTFSLATTTPFPYLLLFQSQILRARLLVQLR
jgi:hypothetical protein